MYDAIVLAGGKTCRALREMSSETYEALIEIAGKPMIYYIVNALAGCRDIGRIFLLGPVEELSHCKFPVQPVIAAAGQSIMDTIANGMSLLDHTDKVLVVTADIPFLTAAAIEDFLGKCAGQEADFYYPIISREISSQSYPKARRTYVRLQEGTFTGGNVFLVNPRIVPQCLKKANHIIARRKNPLRLCGLLGWTFVFRFLCGNLSLDIIQRRASEILGIQGAVIYSRYAEIGMDVDKPGELTLARSKMAARI
ncbi:hypothetical protein P22_1539 [Propionispora sp. 2/2-37]|uniref:nucleotidyltransferase family protein n=1 Tax=Propionispora sp. 2/2-37 TaxID=1677858 RepID=UPI0006BB8651|nr:nucleotidyltransferase family protein [Propionispora sp. 2/2-37]CUH95468.1 hypothetical protein P22_1539 [Propionispora sp. 2/2-37]